jgi:aminopeptidase
MDPRIKKLADTLVNYSTQVKAGENVLIGSYGTGTTALVNEIIKEVYQQGANPFVELIEPSVHRELLLQCNTEQLEAKKKFELEKMKDMDVYIGIRSPENFNETSDVPSEKMQNYQKFYAREVTQERVNHTRWVVLRYPNPGIAQAANMSQAGFEDFYFNVCNLNYDKMSQAMDNLVALMNQTDRVRIIGEGTDLSFSIKDIPAIKCAGEFNIPDGEVFTAPVKDSVNGVLSYNTPAVYQGFTYDDITLEFKDGKIVKATANDTEKINGVFDTDEGARYVGEFAIGVNPYITKPMKDTLFDEKIMGSFHFTPGQAYEEAPNGNESAIHWDLVCIQTPDYGGGEMYFDDVLIRKDGKFVIDELKPLNPENLK